MLCMIHKYRRYLRAKIGSIVIMFTKQTAIPSDITEESTGGK